MATLPDNTQEDRRIARSKVAESAKHLPSKLQDLRVATFNGAEFRF